MDFSPAHEQPVAAELVVRLEEVAAVRPERRLGVGDDGYPVTAAEPGHEPETLVPLRHVLALQQFRRSCQ